MIVVGVLGRPQADLPSDFLGRGRRVARDDLHGYTRVEAFADGCRHVVAYRVRNGRDADEGQRAFGERLLASIGLGFAIGKPQRSHGHVLISRQLSYDFLLVAEAAAPVEYDLRRSFHIQHAPFGRRFDERGHEFALGRERELVDDPGRIAQRGVVDAPVAQPEQQGSLGRVADHAGVGVQKSRRVGRDALVDDRVGRVAV